MRAIKKIINDPKAVVDELLEGVLSVYGGSVTRLPGTGALVKIEIPQGKVGLLVGGGSGHEPLFAGYIGRNMADGAACGNIFAAPPPDTILAATRTLDSGAGVLYVYGNYAGDNMNFDIAAEMAADEGIRVRTVRVLDDVAAAPIERIDDRRGIAGDLFVIKIAGAAAALLPGLDEVYRITALARDNTRSIGVAVAAGSIPETGEPTFVLADDEIEIGMGLHGEPGVSREKLLKADPLVEKMMERLVLDLPFMRGDRVCLLVNDLGSTTMMELLIACRKVRHILLELGIDVYDTLAGSYATCQEMAGFSITLLRLDDELVRYYDLPADSLAFKKV